MLCLLMTLLATLSRRTTYKFGWLSLIYRTTLSRETNTNRPIFYFSQGQHSRKLNLRLFLHLLYVSSLMFSCQDVEIIQNYKSPLDQATFVSHCQLTISIH